MGTSNQLNLNITCWAKFSNQVHQKYWNISSFVLLWVYIFPFWWTGDFSGCCSHFGWASLSPLSPLFATIKKNPIQHSKRHPSTQTNQKIASSFSSWIRQSRRCFSAAFKVHLDCTRDFISAWIVETSIIDERQTEVSGFKLRTRHADGLCDRFVLWGGRGGWTGDFCNPNWDNNVLCHHVECEKPFKEMLVPVL